VTTTKEGRSIDREEPRADSSTFLSSSIYEAPTASFHVDGEEEVELSWVLVLQIGLGQKWFFSRLSPWAPTLQRVILLHLPNPRQNQALALTLIEGDLKTRSGQIWR